MKVKIFSAWNEGILEADINKYLSLLPYTVLPTVKITFSTSNYHGNCVYSALVSVKS